MVKITELDKRILYELDKDGRASFSDIAKKIGTTPQVVKYHCDRFRDEKIIKNFWAFIDYDKAGYSFFWGYWLKFAGISKEKEGEMYAHLNKHPNFPIIMRSDGYFDVMIGLIAKDVFDHNRILQDFLSRFGEYIARNDIVVGIGFTKFLRSYLAPSNEPEVTESQSGGTTEVARLSSIDRKLLSILQIDGRIELSRVANILNVSKSLVYKRYDSLVKKGVIAKTTFTLNHSNIGLQLYRNIFKIVEFNKERIDHFYEYCKKHPNVNNYVRTMGDWQAMIDFEVESKEQMRNILRDIRYEFKDLIREVAVNEVYQIDKFSQMIVEFPEFYDTVR